MKHYRTFNKKDQHESTALERSVINYWGHVRLVNMKCIAVQRITDRWFSHMREFIHMIPFTGAVSYSTTYLAKPCTITKTCLYNFDPLKPHFYIVKLGFTGVNIIFHYLLLRSSLIWVHTVCLYAKCKFEKFARICSRRHKQTIFSDAVFLGALRVNKEMLFIHSFIQNLAPLM